MKIYIACALTHVPREHFAEHAEFIHSLAQSLEQFKNTVKYALVDSDPQLSSKPLPDRARLCYSWDREMVEQSELVIAEASFPGIGLGIELQVAEQKGIPVIICYRDWATNKAGLVQYENPDHSRHELQIGEGYVSLMALGLPTLFQTIQYQNSTDGISKILEATAILSHGR